MKKDFFQTTKVIILALVLVTGISYVFAWVGPTQSPPGGNTPTPLNVGTTNQVKDGGLGLLSLSVFGNGYVQDKLGIGVANPTQTLDIAGFINTDKYSGYKQEGETILYASSTRLSTFTGIGAGMSAPETAPSTGNYNTANGYYSLHSNNSGSSNTANGYSSLGANTTGSYNTANGSGSLLSNTSGYYNTANGMNSLRNNTTGRTNTANGGTALYFNTTGNDNTAIGYSALFNNTGSWNTANGAGSLYYNTTGLNNTAVGENSLLHNTTGSYNTVVGANAGYGGYNLSDVSTNSIFGAWAGSNLQTGGDKNVLIGYSSGGNISTGSNNIVIGGNSIDAPSATDSDQLNIGNLLFGTGLNGTGATISTGNIGIGISSPTEKLDVSGNIKSSSQIMSSTYCDQDGNNCVEATALGGGSLTCTTVQTPFGSDGTTANCPANYTLTGGSCDNSVECHPNGNGQYCLNGSASCTAYAICCKL